MRRPNCGAHELREAVAGERLPVLGVDDSGVIAWRGGQRLLQFAVQAQVDADPKPLA